MPDDAQPLPSRSLFAILRARFDTAVLVPPVPLEDARLGDPRAWQALQDWCLAAEPRVSIATLKGEEAAALANLLCLERDGGLQMQARGSAGGRMALRLKTKLHDVMWWRAREPADAWDCGTLITTDAGLLALSRFQPRRATLIVVAGSASATLKRVIEALDQRSDRFAHCVKLLVLGEMVAGMSVDRRIEQIVCR